MSWSPYTLINIIFYSIICSASAYGVEPLVVKLTKAGADLNTINSNGYTPLLEACHRGFTGIVGALVAGGVKMRYLPSNEKTNTSSMSRAPAQTAFGEAARMGFQKIVQVN